MHQWYSLSAYVLPELVVDWIDEDLVNGVVFGDREGTWGVLLGAVFGEFGELLDMVNISVSIGMVKISVSAVPVVCNTKSMQDKKM